MKMILILTAVLILGLGQILGCDTGIKPKNSEEWRKQQEEVEQQEMEQEELRQTDERNREVNISPNTH